MRFLSVPDLKHTSNQGWEDLREQGDFIVTANGRPVAIVMPVSEENFEGSLKAVRQARALTAVTDMQQRSIELGLDQLSSEEIEAEIASARLGRRARPALASP